MFTLHTFIDSYMIAIVFFRCLKLELKREKFKEIFKLVQVSVITLLMFGLSLVSTVDCIGTDIMYICS